MRKIPLVVVAFLALCAAPASASEREFCAEPVVPVDAVQELVDSKGPYCVTVPVVPHIALPF